MYLRLTKVKTQNSSSCKTAQGFGVLVYWAVIVAELVVRVVRHARRSCANAAAKGAGDAPLAPSSASLRHVSAPIPPAPPVTTATLPARLCPELMCVCVCVRRLCTAAAAARDILYSKYGLTVPTRQV